MTLARNVIWNTVGFVLPILIGVVVVPVIIRQLGVERFGVLSIVWAMIGYFSVFDLGLSRTLTKLTADRLGTDRESEIPELVSTALMIIATCGVVMGAAVALSAGWIARAVLTVSPGLIPETSSAIVWLGVSLPFVLLTTAFIGLLEALQKFALVNAVRSPLGILMYLAPLAALQFDRHLGAMIAVLAALRVITTCVLAGATLHVLPALRGNLFRFRGAYTGPLLTFGGWLTVSNVIGPLMVYFDRFLIAALLGSAAVAYYTVPYDVLTRLWVFPFAIQSVLFPAFTSMHREKSPRLVSVFKRSSQTTMWLLAPPVVGCVLLAREGLRFWVGIPFAENSTNVAKVLAVGVLVNAMARTPFTFVQAAGRASWTAILHLLETPVYLMLLWWLLRFAGIDGAAYAWTARIAVDTIVLYAMAVRLDPRVGRNAAVDAAALVGLSLIAVLIGCLVATTWVRMLLFAIFSAVCAARLLPFLSGAVLPQRSASLPVNGKL